MYSALPMNQYTTVVFVASDGPLLLLLFPFTHSIQPTAVLTLDQSCLLPSCKRTLVEDNGYNAFANAIACAIVATCVDLDCDQKKKEANFVPFEVRHARLDGEVGCIK